MSYYGSRDFDRLVEAKTTVSAHEIEVQARALRAVALGNLAAKAGSGLKKFFAAPAPVATTTAYKLTQRQEALLLQGEAIANGAIAISDAVARLGRAIYAAFKTWQKEIRTRDELMLLDDRTLADIGLTRGDIPRVAAGLWVPENRLAQLRRSPGSSSASNLNKPPLAA
jgi:uncharacterized protein YjiS (DUF1127 family)